MKTPAACAAGVFASTCEFELDVLHRGHWRSHGFGTENVEIFAGIVDLRTDSGRGRAGVMLDEWGCAWALDVVSGRKPTPWAVAERSMADKVSGVLVLSFARGAWPDMMNLVLWRWGSKLPHEIKVHDPSRRLRKLRA